MEPHDLDPDKFSSATAHLSAVDETLADLIKRIGKCTLGRRDDYFTSILVSIINQQLSGSAADSIFGRLMMETDGNSTPDRIGKLSPEQFRKAGISRSKERYLRGLSEKFVKDGSFLSEMDTKSDSEILDVLTGLNGVGRWTAEMFMIFSLNRLDILPIDDAGLRRSISRFYLSGEKATDRRIMEISEKWRPYRSIAVWYLWRAADGALNGRMQYRSLGHLNYGT